MLVGRVLRRHLVEEADDAGQSSVGADGRDIGADHKRVVPVAAQAPGKAGDIVVGVDRARQSEDVVRELALGGGDGRVDGVVAVRVNQGTDVAGIGGPSLAISSRRVVESVSFQQAR
ncbi:MAG TPA: hypothetical protein VG187_18350 [Mycobacterium sp.]|nr:hypothetical protein [Mycobacterium sp.]